MNEIALFGLVCFFVGLAAGVVFAKDSNLAQGYEAGYEDGRQDREAA